MLNVAGKAAFRAARETLGMTVDGAAAACGISKASAVRAELPDYRPKVPSQQASAAMSDAFAARVAEASAVADAAAAGVRELGGQALLFWRRGGGAAETAERNAVTSMAMAFLERDGVEFTIDWLEC